MKGSPIDTSFTGLVNIPHIPLDVWSIFVAFHAALISLFEIHYTPTIMHTNVNFIVFCHGRFYAYLSGVFYGTVLSYDCSGNNNQYGRIWEKETMI